MAILCISANLCLADQYTVINNNDAGAGSFRQAILDANANSGKDTITFTILSTILLETAANVDINLLPSVTDSLCVFGNGCTIQGNVPGRIIQINSPSEINDLIFTGGSSPGTGGAIRTVAAAELCQFNGCAFLTNEAPSFGGGVATDCDAIFKDCFFENNMSGTGGGLAIRFDIDVCIENCSFKDNSATTNGEAIWMTAATVGPPSLTLKSGLFETTMGAFDQTIYVEESMDGTGSVELAPSFEVLLSRSLSIVFGP